VAVSVTGVLLATIVVTTVNVAVVAPAGTVTVEGTDAAGFDELKFTTAPNGPAAAFKVIVPVVEVPPATLELRTLREVSGGMVTSKVTVFFVEPNEALTAPDALVETGSELTVNVAEVWPAEIRTVAGTVKKGLPLLSATVWYPTGTGADNVTVHVARLPPTKLVTFEEIPTRLDVG